MLVLGVETSCDETALALVADGHRVVASHVVSSLKAHQPYGGIVPEIASRAHVELFTLSLELLLKQASVVPSDIDRIAVTHGPGLPGSLLMGVAAAKALALAWKKPIIGVNHLHAHLYAALMQRPQDLSEDLPTIGLVVSGGHTALVRMDGIRKFRLMGQTRDDAVGEAFDKVGKLLKLKFPGGPEIERTAEQGNPKAFRFSVPKIRGGSPFDFSYSGIKTAVYYKVKEQGDGVSQQWVADMAASFQHCVVEELAMKTLEACRQEGAYRLVVGGGVIANTPLRERLLAVCADSNIALAIPPLSLCTDNGAMIAGLGFYGNPSVPDKLSVLPDLRVELN